MRNVIFQSFVSQSIRGRLPEPGPPTERSSRTVPTIPLLRWLPERYARRLDLVFQNNKGDELSVTRARCGL